MFKSTGKGEGWTKFEKGGVGNIGGLYKIGGLFCPIFSSQEKREREKKNFVIVTIDVSDNFFSVFGLLSSKKREKFPKSPNNLYVMFCAI